MSFTVKQTFRVEMGHRTWTHSSDDGTNPCANIHGHTVFISVILEGDALDDRDFLMDTDVLGAAMAPVLDELDHALVLDRSDPLLPQLEPVLKEGGLKYTLVDFSPTFEALVRHVHRRLEPAVLARAGDTGLRVRETRFIGEQTVEATYSPPRGAGA